MKGNFSWGFDKQNSQNRNSVVNLRNIDLKVKKGEFICIIGDVASGKSSLLNAIIGDMLTIDD